MFIITIYIYTIPYNLLLLFFLLIYLVKKSNKKIVMEDLSYFRVTILFIKQTVRLERRTMLFDRLYSSTVERNTVNILINVQFILKAYIVFISDNL